MQGMQLTGYPATGTPPTIQQGANPGPITIPNTLMGAKSTDTAAMQINLNSTDKIPANTPFKPTDADSYNKRAPVTVFDSRGNQHDINLFYVKTGDNTWDIWTQDSSVANSPLVKSAQMTFDKNGGLDNVKEYTEVAPVPPATEPTLDAWRGKCHTVILHYYRYSQWRGSCDLHPQPAKLHAAEYRD